MGILEVTALSYYCLGWNPPIRKKLLIICIYMLVNRIKKCKWQR